MSNVYYNNDWKQKVIDFMEIFELSFLNNMGAVSYTHLLLSIYNEGGKRGLIENINAALPFMDEDMRELSLIHI